MIGNFWFVGHSIWVGENPPKWDDRVKVWTGRPSEGRWYVEEDIPYLIDLVKSIAGDKTDYPIKITLNSD